MEQDSTNGPLTGVKVLEFSGLGPAPFAGMLLSDLGAEVVRIDRDTDPDYKPEDVESRGRLSIILNLKDPEDIHTAKTLATKADILIEGFRPGVMERLELGPDELLTLNPALVYGRITGWGQTGPLAQKAGHDINYLAITGALHAMGTKEKPSIPLNLIADFGGGAMYLLLGVLSAFHHAKNTGQGQVVDAAMSEGVISLMNMIYGDFAVNKWQDKRESNVIDGASPFYNVYQCADDKWISLACIEPQFYEVFINKAALDHSVFANQWSREQWPEMIRELQFFFKQKTRDEWIGFFTEHDICLAPVLSIEEAQHHPHNKERGSFQTIDNIQQASAFPVFSETVAKTSRGVARKNDNREEIINSWLSN